jgi:hypothetical protein
MLFFSKISGISWKIRKNKGLIDKLCGNIVVFYEKVKENRWSYIKCNNRVT